MRVKAALAAMVGSTIAMSVASAAATARPFPFDYMTAKDGEATRTQGTGCSWSARPGRTWALAMADDVAAVKRAGRYVMLKPAPGARDLPPFTHDRWTGGGMTIAVRRTGHARSVGDEASLEPATLIVTEGGRTMSYRGELSCGS